MAWIESDFMKLHYNNSYQSYLAISVRCRIAEVEQSTLKQLYIAIELQQTL